MIQVSRSAIEAYLQEQNISFKDKPAKGDFYICSPFDNSDSEYKCSISYRKNGIFNCLKSGKHGNFLKFVKLTQNCKSYDDAKLYLFRQPWFHDSIFSLPQNEEEKIEILEENLGLAIPYYFEKFNKEKKEHAPYYNYLLRRNIKDELIDRLELYINPSMMHRRIVFTVYENGKLIFYTGRTIDDSRITLRWYSQALDGYDPVFFVDKNNPTYYVFEGMFDCLRMPGGVATFGASVSEKKVQKIIDNNPSKIVVVMDDDAAGLRAQYNIADSLATKHNNVYVFSWKTANLHEKDFSALDEDWITSREYDKHLIRWDNIGKLKYKLLNKELDFPIY